MRRLVQWVLRIGRPPTILDLPGRTPLTRAEVQEAERLKREAVAVVDRLRGQLDIIRRGLGA